MPLAVRDVCDEWVALFRVWLEFSVHCWLRLAAPRARGHGRTPVAARGISQIQFQLPGGNTHVQFQCQL